MSFLSKWLRPTTVPPQPESASDCIKQGNELLGQGKLEEAKERYEAALRVAPTNVDARVNLGFVLTRLGEDEAARSHLDRAVELAPDQHDAHYLLGLIGERERNFEDTVRHLSKALDSNPEFASARQDLCRVYLEAGRLEEARVAVEQGLLVTPGSAILYLYLGHIYIRQELWQSAIEAFQKLLELDSDNVDALQKTGDAQWELGYLDEAIASYDRAIRIRPENAEAHNNRGVVLKKQERLEEALASFERAIFWDAEYAEAYSNRGIVLNELNRLDAAVESCDHAIALRADFVEAYVNRSISLDKLGRIVDALADADRAIGLRHGYAPAWFCRGNALRKLGRLEEALKSYEQASNNDPSYAEVYSNRGLVFQDLGQVAAALASFEYAIRLKPEFVDAHFNEGICRLLMGDMVSGWGKYHWRWRLAGLKESLRNDLAPLWLGMDDLHGKAILLYAEQGFGDTIQFCRYARDVALLGAQVILEVPPPLASLLSGLPGVSRLITRGDPLPPVDYQCPLLTLPLAFKTELSDIKGEPYLKSSPDRAAAWDRLLGRSTRPRVGIVWSGNREHLNDRNRSVAVSEFLDALIPGVEYICIQKEIRPEDREILLRHPEIRCLGEQLADFSDTAALIDAMDLVISVDTSVVHLAGALGKPVWILLPYAPDWRWLLGRSDSPWYRSATLFRQARPGDWAGVFEEIGRRLQALSVQEH